MLEAELFKALASDKRLQILEWLRDPEAHFQPQHDGDLGSQPPAGQPPTGRRRPIMATQRELARQFLALHEKGAPLLMPNPWDEGSAKLMASLGFKALATTSGGFAATKGLHDGSVSRGDALAHAALIAAATELPVSADLENGYARDIEAVAETYRSARQTGLAGASIEDYDPEAGELYETGLASERVAAAAEAFHSGDARLVLTGRAENHLRGNPELADTIARLQAYQEAGADVLYAPFLTDLDDIRSVVESVDRPVNVLVRPDGPSVAELASVGVARISVGGAFALAAFGAAVNAARELLEEGTYSWSALTRTGAEAARSAFGGA
jgi:2-methylisocitrate lyase-like PEP mutase family enzyme